MAGPLRLALISVTGNTWARGSVEYGEPEARDLA